MSTTSRQLNVSATLPLPRASGVKVVSPLFFCPGVYHYDDLYPIEVSESVFGRDQGIWVSHFETYFQEMDYKAYQEEYNGVDLSDTLGQFQECKQATCFHAGEYGGISSLAFDLHQNLLWAATYGGHVTSFFSSSLDKYTSFQAHHEDIRQVLCTGAGVVSVTENELRMTSRTGLPMFTMKGDHALCKMNCALYLDDTSLLVGCHNNKITTVDLTQAQVTQETLTTAGVCLLKPSESYVCCGDVLGKVGVLDPMTLHTVASFSAHVAGMCDMDIVGNYLVTCGLGQQYGQLCVDPQLKVFDLRFLRPVSPYEVTMLQPFLVRCVPAMEATLLVLSQTGKFQLLDLRGLVTPSNMVVHRLGTSSEEVLACSMDVSPSCQCLAFGDSSGVVHLWAEREEVIFNPYATQETVFPDQVEESLPEISWDPDDTASAPLSAVPMPLNTHTRSPLFSHWPVHCSRFTRRMTPVIDPEVLENMRMSQFVGHAPKPSHIRYNQVPYDLDRDTRDHVPESPMKRESNPLTLIPKPYRQVEIKYSKLGIETFDFSHYNGTKFAGLEIHIPNAYCNSMLQVLYFLEPIRCAMQQHLCSKEFCLACELGLLFRMLDHSEGESCQANNFLRAFRTLREASALGLLLNWENEERKVNLGKLAQSWTRFVLQQLNQETDPNLQPPPMSVATPTSALGTPSTPSFKMLTPGTPTTPMVPLGMDSFLGGSVNGPGGGVATGSGDMSVVEQLFGSTVKTEVRCGCGWSTVTKRAELLFSLHYPHNLAPPYGTVDGRRKSMVEQKVSFSSVVGDSICRQQRVHSWCERCTKYKSTTHEKSLCTLPQVLTLNCQIESDKDSDFWLAQQRQDKAAAGSSAVTTLTRWVPFNLTLKICKDGMLEVLQDVKPGKSSPTSTLASTSGSDQSTTTPDVSPMATSTTTSSSDQSQGGEGKEVEESLPESDDAVIVGGDKEEEEEPLPLTAIEDGDGGGKAGGETVTVIEGGDGAGGETEDVKEGEEEGREGMSEEGQGTGIVKEEMEGGEVRGKCDGSGEEKLAESEGEVSDGGGGDGEVRVDLEAEFELAMVVCHVRESWIETAGNLIAHIRVGPSYHLRKEGKAKSQWYLFNDFHITPIKESEVGIFQMEWLTPAVIIYTCTGCLDTCNTPVNCHLDPIVLLTETHTPRPAQSPATFTPLAFSELPSSGDLVGIDAEFVTLNQEEAEVRSDGTHTTVKPSQYSVARITAIRGRGPMEGSPFIDDYIATSEQVVDYLTKFSGIRPGDLDASMSSKHLTTLKASYLKLLYLLECGVIFVGHGLNKDFRVINILVPPTQIVDTVKLFHLPKQRYVSLKFLAWFLLDLHVQQGAHDSCEDARTALLLYRKYMELQASDQVSHMLGKLYETGRHYNWQVPKS